MNVHEFYANLNINPTDVLHRFGDNEALLEKFLKKLLNDTTFIELTQAMEKKDWEVIFRTAHTLKGLFGNFGFTELFNLSAKIVELYRSNTYDEIPKWYKVLEEKYQFTLDTLIKHIE